MKRIAVVLSALLAAVALFPIAHAAADTVADIKVTVTGPASVAPGSSATYQMTVRNDGPDTIGSVGADAKWSTNFSLARSGITGIDSQSPCFFSTSTPAVTCTMAGGPMAAGVTRTVTFTGTVSQTATGNVSFTASANPNNGVKNADPVPDDNSGTVTSAVVIPCS